jgi:hypothetical protein
MPTVRSIVPEMLKQEFNDTVEGNSNLFFLCNTQQFILA